MGEHAGGAFLSLTSEQSGDDSTDGETMNNRSSGMVENALQLLHDHRLDDAEPLLRKGFNETNDRGLKVKALNALAEICYRKSRTNTSHPMECYWLMLHATTLLTESVEICRVELDENLQSSHDSMKAEDSEWFEERMETSVKKLRRFEEITEYLLYMYIHNHDRMDSFSCRSTPMSCTPSYSASLFPLTPTIIYHQDVFKGQLFTGTSVGDANRHACNESTVERLSMFETYCSRRIQGATPIEIVKELFGKDQKNVNDSGNFTDENESTSSTNELGLDNSQMRRNGQNMRTRRDVMSERIDINEIGIRNRELHETGRMDYVEKLWSNSVNVNVADDNARIDINSNCEQFRVDDNVIENGVAVPAGISVSPVSESKLKYMLCAVLLSLTRKVEQEDGNVVEACEIVEEIRKIFEQIPEKSNRYLRLHGDVMKRKSEILRDLGERDEIIDCLHAAVSVYREIVDEDVKLDVAVLLVELGNVTLGKFSETCNSRYVYDSVVEAIADTLDNDVRVNAELLKSPQSTRTIDAENDRRDVELLLEAIDCYREVVTTLGESCEGDSFRVYTQAIVKLGDCYFMSGNYHDALENYEESLVLFRRISGSDAIKSQAHILCMVAVNTFMLGLYPKAALTFECAYRMMKRATDDETRFGLAMVLSLLGLSMYKLKLYQKCITWCYQAFEMYMEIFEGGFDELSQQKLWILGQTIYMLGVSYNQLKLYDRSIRYLTIGRNIMSTAKNVESRQHLRILQILGDSYFAKTEYETALVYYHEALELNVNKDDDSRTKQSSFDLTAYSNLLSASADAHMSLQNYTYACDYFEQASVMQTSITDSVKADLARTLHNLGEMNASTGDVDKAIESYRESLEIQDEIGDEDACTISETCTNLAALCYMKALMADDDQDYIDRLIATESNFQRALERNPKPSSYVKYVNFLQSQGSHVDAVVYLTDLLEQTGNSNVDGVTYSDVENLLLPNVLQNEFEFVNDLTIPLYPFALYLLITSRLYLKQISHAEDSLLQLIEVAILRENSYTYSLLGYSHMHLRLFDEAALSFYHSLRINDDNSRIRNLFYSCLCIWFLKSVENVLFAISTTALFNK